MLNWARLKTQKTRLPFQIAERQYQKTFNKIFLTINQIKSNQNNNFIPRLLLLAVGNLDTRNTQSTY